MTPEQGVNLALKVISAFSHIIPQWKVRQMKPMIYNAANIRFVTDLDELASLLHLGSSAADSEIVDSFRSARDAGGCCVICVSHRFFDGVVICDFRFSDDV